MPVHILFCTLAYFPAFAGGAEKQAQLQAEELARRGHAVTVVCPNSRGQKSGTVNGVFVKRLARIDRRSMRTATYILSLTLFLVLRLRSFDLAHVHLANFQAHRVVLIAELLRRPTYVKIASSGERGDIAELARWARYTKFVGLRRATRVQALSAAIVEEAGNIGVPAERIVNIPNGVDLHRFLKADDAGREVARQRLNLPLDAVIVLYAGRFARHKGLLDLIGAWETLDCEEAKLVLVGSYATSDPIKEIPLSDNMIVRAWTDEIDAFYRAADIFVLPSSKEGMSNSLLEAMASGLAVITTRVGAADKIVVDGKNGLLIDPGDAEHLGAVLSRLLGDAPMRKKLGSAAARDVRQFNISRVVDKIESVYRQLIDGDSLSSCRQTRPRT